MNVMFFHLMPYAELPDDFRESHPSIWVDIDSRLFDPERGGAMYRDYLDELEEAAALGFDGVCVNEHHSNGYGMMPSPNLMASVLARNTTRGAVCVMGNAPALYDPPLRVAEEMAMLDCISGGRLIAGLPLGTPMDTCYAYGRNPSTLRDKYVEACELVVRAWQEREPFAFAGRFYQAPLRQHLAAADSDAPPAHLDTRRRLAGHVAHVWPERLRVRGAVVLRLPHRPRCLSRATGRSLRARGGSPIRSRPATCSSSALPRRSARHWSSTASRPSTSTPTACTPTRASRCRPATRPRSRSASVPANPTRATRWRSSPPHPPTTRSWSAATMIVGTPDEVAERLRDIAVDLNIGQLMLLLHFGNMDRDLTRANTRLFAERVLPQLRRSVHRPVGGSLVAGRGAAGSGGRLMNEDGS